MAPRPCALPTQCSQPPIDRFLASLPSAASRLSASCCLILGQAQLVIGLLAPLQGGGFKFFSRDPDTCIELAAFGVAFALFRLRRRALARNLFLFLLALTFQLVQLTRVLLRAI